MRSARRARGEDSPAAITSNVRADVGSGAATAAASAAARVVAGAGGASGKALPSRKPPEHRAKSQPPSVSPYMAQSVSIASAADLLSFGLELASARRDSGQIPPDSRVPDFPDSTVSKLSDTFTAAPYHTGSEFVESLDPGTPRAATRSLAEMDAVFLSRLNSVSRELDTHYYHNQQSHRHRLDTPLFAGETSPPSCSSVNLFRVSLTGESSVCEEESKAPVCMGSGRCSALSSSSVNMEPLGCEGANAASILPRSFNSPNPGTLATPNLSTLASIVPSKTNADCGQSSKPTTANPIKNASASQSRASVNISETEVQFPPNIFSAAKSHGLLDLRVISASTLVDESVSEEELRISAGNSAIAPGTKVKENETETSGGLKNKKKKKNNKKKRGKQKKKALADGEQSDVTAESKMEEILTNKTSSNECEESSFEGLEDGGAETGALVSFADEKGSIQVHLAEVAETLAIRDFAGVINTSDTDSNCFERKETDLRGSTAIADKSVSGGISIVSGVNLSRNSDSRSGNSSSKRNPKSSVADTSNEQPLQFNKNPRTIQSSQNACAIPEFQKIVVSSAIDASFYADIIDEITRVLGYLLISLSRKPDICGSSQTPQITRRFSFQSDTQIVPETCTKGSLHIQVQRTAKSTPLTRAALLMLQKKTTRNRNASPTTAVYITAAADANAASTAPQDTQKCDQRVVRAATYGAYVRAGLGACASVPEVVCIVARGGFGVPVLRRFTLATASQHAEEDDWEFVGVRWVRGGLGEHQARAVTPYGVGHPKWRDSLRWLCTTTGESDDGYMVVVVRKLDGFRAVDAILASLLESYISINSKSESSRLSLLSSLNAEMAYSTLTVFFRDYDLIPPQQSAQRHQHRREHGPDDTHAAANGAAIAQSLVSPPRGAYTFCILRNKEGPGTMRAIAVLCARLIDSGCVVCGLRVTSVGHLTAARMAEWPQRDGVDADWSMGDDNGDAEEARDPVGVPGSDFPEWITDAGSVIMLVIGPSGANSHALTEAVSPKPQYQGQQQQ
ncbi:hypothetical protein HDU84_002584 [Entophlyctis sp. JEL0112]|nr:hypothetical protein HDU84_002584 [Entophlyctis sp. JEL0112]